MSVREIQFGNRTIRFDLVYSSRKTLEISVLPDRRVIVKAPAGKSEAQVLQRVRQRARWIVRQQAYFLQFDDPQPAKKYISGESFRYLGRQYRLKVISPTPDDDAAAPPPCNECVRLVGGYLRVYSRHKDDGDRVRRLVTRWYREHARRKFAERLHHCAKIVARFGIHPSHVTLRAMKNRWGSCTASGTILLNPRLIEFPTYCIDYVILHELIHLKHRHHGKEFYQLLDTVLPEWPVIKRRLEQPVE